jgi:hypothetical protein
MASEIVEGKRTFIERGGHVFRLPERHTVKLVALGDGTKMVSLTALMQGSSFQLRKLEELKDRVIVHLGPELGRHGPPGGEALGYPFPHV